MQPIPEAALPVVEIIRHEVPRPVELPTRRKPPYLGRSSLRFKRTCLNVFGFCPMGLCPNAQVPAMYSPMYFGYDVTAEATIAFAQWWDSIPESEAREAVDAVWGE